MYLVFLLRDPGDDLWVHARVAGEVPNNNNNIVSSVIIWENIFYTPPPPEREF